VATFDIGDVFATADPIVKIGVAVFHNFFEQINVRFGETLYVFVGETTHQEVHFSHPAMPTAKFNSFQTFEFGCVAISHKINFQKSKDTSTPPIGRWKRYGYNTRSPAGKSTIYPKLTSCLHMKIFDPIQQQFPRTASKSAKGACVLNILDKN
jgi:hypothetical protein